MTPSLVWITVFPHLYGDDIWQKQKDDLTGRALLAFDRFKAFKWDVVVNRDWKIIPIVIGIENLNSYINVFLISEKKMERGMWKEQPMRKRNLEEIQGLELNQRYKSKWI